MFTRRRHGHWPVFVGAIGIWLVATAAAARPAVRLQQATDEPMQLEVLPKTWTREQVDLVMETFNTSLGVDCDYCHVEAPGPTPSGEKTRLDYASDEKQEKAVSRRMISLTMAINEDLEDEIVSCYTCHNGKATPALSPAAGWGRGRFTFTDKGPTVPAPGTAPAPQSPAP